MILIFSYNLGFPHIHGVAWILQLWLDDKGFGNKNLCEAPEEKVAELADELISCQLPEPITLGPASSPEDKKQHDYQKKLRDSVIKVLETWSH